MTIASFQNKKINIGLIGFGCVGQGFYKLCSQSADGRLHIKSVAAKNPDKIRNVRPETLVFDPDLLIADGEIDTIVEAIDDADAAFALAKKALLAGKHLVTANKKMLSQHLRELETLAAEKKLRFYYEASVGGSIPVIQLLKGYYAGSEIKKISGILNGSTNYILSRMYNEGLEYTAALKQAQNLGFAETDPLLDVGAFDPKSKISILSSVVFGYLPDPEEVLNIGIQSLEARDISFARQRGYKIRLLAEAAHIDGSLALRVLPAFVGKDSEFYGIENEYNAVLVETADFGSQLITGKGAGSIPTGKAVLEDVRRILLSGDSGGNHARKYTRGNNGLIQVYLRFPGKRLPESIRFKKTREIFTSSLINYATGWLEPEQLLANRELLGSQGYFVAVLPECYPAVLLPPLFFAPTFAAL
jgi:homoserine dehydrogenase